MRILQINSVCDIGSTGRTTRELADFLEGNGHECYVAYGHGTTTYKKSFKIGGVLENHWHNLLYTRFMGLQGYGTRRGTRALVRWIDSIKPDVIHLRNLHANYLNYPILFNYIIQNKIPVLFTLHDCYNFTGKCTHFTARQCYKWKTECNHCPVFQEKDDVSLFFDCSGKIFIEKRDYYSKIPRMTVVAVSKWLMGQAKDSILADNGHKVTYIYNWIDINKFHPATEEKKSAFAKKYSLSGEYKYLISVSQSWDQGASRFQDAVKLSSVLPTDYRLILVGGTLGGTVIPSPIIHIPYISGTEDLCAAYSFSNAYIHFSVEDSFAKVISEAMACGTIPISFNSTACAETPGPFGIVVPPHDVEAIIKNLPLIDEKKKDRDQMLQYVYDNYGFKSNALKYIDLYNELLK